jgi:hypothetical protein
MSDLNQRLHEALGLCWHHWVLGKQKFDESDHFYCTKCGYRLGYTETTDQPDYVADPRLVLREMQKREDWIDFCESNRWIWANYMAIKIDVILDTTGKLARLALDWLKSGEDGGRGQGC